MLYQLLPFFLAVSSPASNETWKYGPEYIFSGHVKMITDLKRDEGVLWGNKLIFDARCQPRTNDTLICRLEDTKIARIRPSAYDTAGKEETEVFKPAGVMREMFGVKFNEKGIDSYIIEKTDPPLVAHGLDMSRLIFNQLSVGAKISDENTPKFRLSENFTIGECQVDYTVTRKTLEKTEGNSANFELVALENLGKLNGDSIEIEKKRDVKDCLVCADYFFGTRYIFGLVYRDVLTKIKSSTSKIFIRTNGLRAETINEVEVFGQDRQSQGNMLDHMVLELTSVLPASAEFEPMKNPVEMEVVANRPGSPYVE